MQRVNTLVWASVRECPSTTFATTNYAPAHVRRRNAYLNEPPWLAGLNDVGEVIEAINRALERPERFTSEHLSAVAVDLAEVALRGGVYEPHD